MRAGLKDPRKVSSTFLEKTGQSHCHPGEGTVSKLSWRQVLQGLLFREVEWDRIWAGGKERTEDILSENALGETCGFWAAI